MRTKLTASLILLALTAVLLVISPVYGLNYSPDSVTLAGGVYTSGNVFSLTAIDGDLYIVTEEIGAPYLDVRAEFIGLEDLTNTTLALWGFYDGNPAHEVNVSAWDGGAWVDLATITDDPTRTVTDYSVDVTGYILAGELSIKIYHVQNGVAGHTLELDLLRLEGDIIPAMIAQIDWFYMAIWAAILILGLASNKPPITALGALLGWFVGFTIFASLNTFIMLVLFTLNLYILYDSLDNWDKA